jgi:hypothetical protein
LEFPKAEAILGRLGLGHGVAPARLRPDYPGVAVQIAPGRVCAVQLVRPKVRRGEDARPILTAFREAALPAAAVDPALAKPNLADPDAVRQAAGEVLAAVAPRERRISLVLPDSAARISILRFNRMPASRRELLDLVRFRLQKVLPFRIEEAALDYHLLHNGGAETEFLVALVQRPVVWQYEGIFEGLGRLPGLVDLDSLDVANLHRACRGSEMGTGDEALVNAAEGYLTVLFFRDGMLNFCRSKPIPPEEQDDPVRFFGAVRRELASCSAYYREHLEGAGLRRVTLRVVERDPGSLAGIAQEELGGPAELLAPARAVRVAPGVAPAPEAWPRLAPALGAALGRRE